MPSLLRLPLALQLSLAGCELLSDGGVSHLSGLTALTALALSGAAKVRALRPYAHLSCTYLWVHPQPSEACGLP